VLSVNLVGIKIANTKGYFTARSYLERADARVCHPSACLSVRQCIVFYCQISSKCQIFNTKLAFTVTMKSIIYHVKHVQGAANKSNPCRVLLIS